MATGLDLWAAATLRRAGLKGVRPQASEPFYASQLALDAAPALGEISAELKNLEEIRDELSSRALTKLAGNVNGTRRRLGTHLKRIQSLVVKGGDAVLGEGRRKRIDVFVADWDRGLELLISTKTIALTANDATKVLKNLPNRWEEFDGDLKNLRGRFPLAVIGVLIVIPSVEYEKSLPPVIDMMTKLTAEKRPWTNAYDRAAIIVTDPWSTGATRHVKIRNDDQGIAAQLPANLQPSTFFDAMVEGVLLRAPIGDHIDARAAKAAARGEDPEAIRRAAAMVGEVDQYADDERPE